MTKLQASNDAIAIKIVEQMWQEKATKKMAKVHTKRIQIHEHITSLKEDEQDSYALKYKVNKCNLIFEIEHNGEYHTRFMACSYSQVPRADFSKMYSLFMYDIMFWILLLMVIHFQFLAKIVDIKTAFSMGILNKVYI